MWFGSESYENFNLRLEDVRIEGFNVGILAPVHAGIEGASINGAFLRNYVNVAFEERAEPNTLRLSNVQYAPSYTVRIAQSFPVNVANVWHEGHGTIEKDAFQMMLRQAFRHPCLSGSICEQTGNCDCTDRLRVTK